MADETTTTTKSGWKTTEFWLSLAAAVVGVLMSSGIFGDESLWMKVLGMAATLLAAVGYTVSRTIVKK